jgi:hypothetical protein
MDYLDLINEFKSEGFPAAYGKFKETKPLPFILISNGDNDNLKADNITYLDIEGYDVELYTAAKHPPTEKSVQNKLKELGIDYNKIGPEYIDSEDFYQTIYEISLIGG